MNRFGNLDKLYEIQKRITEKSRETNIHKNEIRKQQVLSQWISERHACENCGTIMESYYGSGRFCSRRCANSGRTHSDEEKSKISKSILKVHYPLLSDSEIEAISLHNKEKSASKKKRYIYDGPDLPEIERLSLKKGYQNRHSIPYSEQFWKKVLDNNGVQYEQNVPIWKPGLNNYWLDFLIDNKIDLEIDGSLHETKDVSEKDKRRTLYLESLGYVIYRIKWVNPVTDKKKAIVKKQIEDLLFFISKHKSC